MSITIDPLDRALLDNWQRNFPLVSRPFAKISQHLGIAEDAVLDRLRRLADRGAVSRIGGTCRPGTAGASTLAALAAPDWRVDEIGEAVSAESGVNHVYLRENRWNIWFVATGPDRAHVDAALRRIGATTGCRVLDLRLVRAFNVDLGFMLDGSGGVPPARAEVDTGIIAEGDREIMQALSSGLEIVARPFAALATALERSETEILERIGTLAEAGILSRIGVIVRHRALGWRSNAMVVWDVRDKEIERVGTVLSAVPGVTLCYQRRAAPGFWPYNLYAMMHARSRAEAMAVLARASFEARLDGMPHQVLFSTRCFKQTGALVAASKGRAA